MILDVRMQCPQCQKEMRLLEEETSVHPQNKKRYHRTTFWCEKDDVWISTEMPVKN